MADLSMRKLLMKKTKTIDVMSQTENGITYWKLADIAAIVGVSNFQYAVQKCGAETKKFYIGHGSNALFVDTENYFRLAEYFKTLKNDTLGYSRKMYNLYDKLGTLSESDKESNAPQMPEQLSSLYKTFLYGEKPVRIVIQNDEPWFVAADVCKVLEIGNSRMALERLDNDEKGVSSIDTLGGTQKMSIINEPGLYTLVLGSRKPEAKDFKRWITHEVIPSIRKHGMYATDELLNNPDIAIAAFTALKEEREKLKLAEEKILLQQEENSKLKEVNRCLIKDTREWSKKNIVTALIRSYGFTRLNGDYKYAYNIFYKELRYKKGICLSNRSGGKGLIDRIRDDEWEDAIQVAIALCESVNIDTASVINDENMKVSVN